MNIQSIRYFSIVAELENVSKAAELLHTTQSALSKTIFGLENELGTKLFDRKGKKLVLNEAGMRFLESCKLILAETDNAIRDISNMNSGEDNAIRICIEGINESFFEGMSAFKRENPHTEFIIDAMPDGDYLPNINEYDVIVYPDERKYSKYKGFNFYKEKFHFAISSKSLIADRPSLPIKEMDGFDYVFLRRNEMSEYPYQVCKSLTVAMNTCSFTSSRTVHRQMISSGIAAGFIPDGQLEIYKLDNNISVLPILDSKFERQIKICFKREKHLSELADAFVKFIINKYNLKD